MTMSKAWSLRYALVRAQLGWEETLAHLTTSTASLPDAIAKGLEVYRKELTKVILFTGIDLTPSLQSLFRDIYHAEALLCPTTGLLTS